MPYVSPNFVSKTATQAPRLKDSVVRGGRLVQKPKPRTRAPPHPVKQKGFKQNGSLRRTAMSDQQQVTLDLFGLGTSQSTATSSQNSTAEAGSSGGQSQVLGNFEAGEPAPGCSSIAVSQPSGPLPSSDDSVGPFAMEDCDLEMQIDYLKLVKSSFLTQRTCLARSPWITPDDPHAEVERMSAARRAAGQNPLSSRDVMNIVSRPPVFLWAPTVLYPWLPIHCPQCKWLLSTDGKVEWGDARLMHTIDGHAAFISTRHVCQRCSCNSASVGQRQHNKRFHASSEEIMNQMPADIQLRWSFPSTKKAVCDKGLIDYIRTAGVYKACTCLRSMWWVSFC